MKDLSSKPTPEGFILNYFVLKDLSEACATPALCTYKTNTRTCNTSSVTI